MYKFEEDSFVSFSFQVIKKKKTTSNQILELFQNVRKDERMSRLFKGGGDVITF